MPISIKTMRDLWDKKRKESKEDSMKVMRSPLFPEEIQCHFREYLARRGSFLKHKPRTSKTFSAYKDNLGDGGFLEMY